MSSWHQWPSLWPQPYTGQEHHCHEEGQTYSIGAKKLASKAVRQYTQVDVLFRQNHKIIKVCLVFVFGLQTLKLIDFSKIYQLKGLKPKNKGHMNFYEYCDLTKKVYLVLALWSACLNAGCGYMLHSICIGD